MGFGFSVSTWWLIGIIWMICGFINYGWFKGICKSIIQYNKRELWSIKYELGAWLIGLMGPIALMSTIFLIALTDNAPYWVKVWSFCLRMPDELCREPANSGDSQ